MDKLQIAVNEYMDRQDRITHPVGHSDNGGRWYPSKEERCECCDSIREPSRSYPYNLMTHCRTMRHIANLYNVKVSDIRKAINV